MTWKDEIRKDDEEDRKYKIIAPLLEKIEEYMQDNDLDQVSTIKKAFEELEFELMSDIGHTGKYENDDATPMEDAMYRDKERQGNPYQVINMTWEDILKEDWHKKAGKEMYRNRKEQELQSRITKLQEELQKLIKEKDDLTTQQAQNE